METILLLAPPPIVCSGEVGGEEEKRERESERIRSLKISCTFFFVFLEN
jgi:hypothetical protein